MLNFLILIKSVFFAYIWAILCAISRINQLLKQDGADLVDGVVDIEEAINYNAEEYYLKLKKEQNQLDQSSNEISNAGLEIGRASCRERV